MAAEAIVSTVLEQLILITGREVEQEVKLVTGVRKEIEKLTGNFEAIQAVLVDAEQRQVKEAAVGVWLDRLKDASYDMDDVLDEWNTAILKLQIEGVENAQIPKKNVRFLFSSPCFCFRQIALRHDIGVKIKELNENLDSIAIEKDKYNLNAIRSIEEPQRLKTTSFIEVSEIRGRIEEKIDLVNKLLSESKQERASLPVISIVGLGGIGKTTLAQFIYNDTEIMSKFDHRVWVCVSDPFDEVKIARAINEGLKGPAPNLKEFQSLLECIRQTIVNKKFLLILDDVWEENDHQWKQLYNSLNDGLHGESRILVTTRKEKVAQMMKSSDVINIGELSSEGSWSLFEQLAFYDRSQEECGNLENIGREIVGRCKGLPLAIKTIGSFLRFKTTREQWQRILESEIWKLKESKELEEGIFHPLLLSYNDLPSMVKRCFSYCAIFPKDYEMKKDKLIKLWMAQGYLGLEHDAEIEIIGEECFNTLAMHSFFQEFEKDDNGNINKCKMHDIVHDFAQFVVKNECFSKEIYDCEEASLDVSCEKARHSMLTLNFCDKVNICGVKKLRSLLINGGYESLLMICFSQLTCLRALELSGSLDIKIPSKIGKLIHLRYLNMSWLDIEKLPKTLCCLYNLQTLNIRNCKSLKKLPKGMGKLINLRYLLNRGTEDLRYMPKEIERLVSLRTLDRFIVGGDPNGMGLGCLKNMNKLRGRLFLVGLGEVVDEAEAKNAQLMKKKNLVQLELNFCGGSEISSVEECNKDTGVLEALQPPPNLEILWIKECRSISLSPHWMVSLIHLKKLYLSRCSNCEYLPANLGKLPLLEYLDIRDMESVKRGGNEFVGIETSSSSSSSPSLIAFPKLKTLYIEDMENWEEWEYKITAGDITIMPSLSKLHIKCCPKLKSLPDQLLHATSLEKLTIKDCNCEYLPALGKLPHLEYLEISGMKSVKRVGNEFVGIETSSSSSSSPSLIAFPKLKTLYIEDMENWEEWEYKITAGDITIMPSLSKLHIKCCPKLKSLPDQLLHATSLEKLTIKDCNCEYLPALGKLPHLEYLEISGMKSVKRVGNKFVGIETSSSSSSSPSLIAFPKLKTLIIYDMENWEEWEYKITAGDITIMPSLSELWINFCLRLKSLPDHLLHATALQRLSIYGCDILEGGYKVEKGENGKEYLKKKTETCNEESSNAVQN